LKPLKDPTIKNMNGKKFKKIPLLFSNNIDIKTKVI